MAGPKDPPYVSIRERPILRLPMLDREIGAIAPLFPRTDVIPHSRVPNQPQRKVRMRSAISALAIGDDLSIRPHPGALVHRLQFRSRLECAAGGEILRPLEVHGTRHGAATGGSHGRAAVL